jgi:hypothetical protein
VQGDLARGTEVSKLEHNVGEAREGVVGLVLTSARASILRGREGSEHREEEPSCASRRRADAISEEMPRKTVWGWAEPLMVATLRKRQVSEPRAARNLIAREVRA